MSTARFKPEVHPRSKLTKCPQQEQLKLAANKKYISIPFIINLKRLCSTQSIFVLPNRISELPYKVYKQLRILPCNFCACTSEIGIVSWSRGGKGGRKPSHKDVRRVNASRIWSRMVGADHLKEVRI